MRPIPSGRLAYLLRGTLLTTIASATINFGAGIALARLCGPSALGQFVLLASSAHLAFAILSPGFDQAYIQNPNEPGRWAAAVWLTAVQGVLLLSLPIGLLAALLAVKPEWMPVLDLAGFSYIMLGIACTLAGNLLLAPLAVSLSYGKVNGIRLFATVLSTSFAVGWAYQRPSADFAPLVAREACAGILLLMGAMLRTRLPPWPGPPNFSEIKAMLRFSTNLWALNVLEKCIQRVEYLTLGIVTSASDVGVYFAIRSIFDGIYGVLSLPIQSVLFSHLCRDDRKDRFLKSITSTRAIRTLITTLLGVAVAGSLLAPLFSVLLGSHFSAHWGLSASFATLVAGLLMFELIKITMMSFNRHRALLAARGAQLLMLMMGIPVLGHFSDLAGAALAATLATALLLLNAMLQARRLSRELM